MLRLTYSDGRYSLSWGKPVRGEDEGTDPDVLFDYIFSSGASLPTATVVLDNMVSCNLLALQRLDARAKRLVEDIRREKKKGSASNNLLPFKEPLEEEPSLPLEIPQEISFKSLETDNFTLTEEPSIRRFDLEEEEEFLRFGFLPEQEFDSPSHEGPQHEWLPSVPEEQMSKEDSPLPDVESLPRKISSTEPMDPDQPRSPEIPIVPNINPAVTINVLQASLPLSSESLDLPVIETGASKKKQKISKNKYFLTDKSTKIPYSVLIENSHAEISPKGIILPLNKRLQKTDRLFEIPGRKGLLAEEAFARSLKDILKFRKQRDTFDFEKPTEEVEVSEIIEQQIDTSMLRDSSQKETNLEYEVSDLPSKDTFIGGSPSFRGHSTDHQTLSEASDTEILQEYDQMTIERELIQEKCDQMDRDTPFIELFPPDQYNRFSAAEIFFDRLEVSKNRELQLRQDVEGDLILIKH